LRATTPGGQTYVVKDTVRIGRLTNQEIVLDDSSVSRRHAVIRPVEQGWQVVDCSSTNGTYLNSVRLGDEPCHFGAGNIIHFGKVAFSVEMAEEFWLGATEPKTLLGFIKGISSDRKLRLFGCACVSATQHRPSSHYSTQHWDEVLAAAYRLADNSISQHELCDLSSRMNGLEWITANLGDNCLGHATQIELLAETLKLRDELFSGILGPQWEWRPSLQQQVIYAYCLRDIFGNPFRGVTLDPSWRTSTVVALAQAIYQENAFDQMPILADALQDADCDNEDILNHCRQPGEHCRGCWVLDLILGKS
jgi:hypothetical protein